MQRTTAVIVILLGLYSWLSYMAMKATVPSPEEIKISQQMGPPSQSETEEVEVIPKPSSVGTGFAFVILTAILVVVGIASRGSSFKDTLKQPAYAALIGILTLNVLAYIFAYPAWSQFWNHQTLFWAVSISIILFVYFLTRPQVGFRCIAYGIGVFIIIGLVTVFSSHKKKGGEEPPTGTRTVAGDIVVTIEGPVDEWSDPVPVGTGFNFTTGWLGEGKPRHQIEYTTRDDEVLIKEFPTKDGKEVRIPGEVGKFRAKSLETEPVIVKIVLSPIR